MAERRLLSFEEFRGLLSETLGVAQAALTWEAHFLNDLAIDSLKLVELLLQLERQVGKRIPTEAAWEILTVGEAYDYYVREFAPPADLPLPLGQEAYPVGHVPQTA